MKTIFLFILTILFNTIDIFGQNISSLKEYNNIELDIASNKLMLPSVPSSTDYFFKKHCNLIDISLGVGNYGVTVNNSINKTGNGGQNLLALNYEFAISHRFGIGAILELGGLNNSDLNTKFGSGVFGIKGYYHFYNAEKATVYTYLALCAASANSENTNLKISKMTSGGNNSQLGIGIRKQLYKKWLGFHANLAFVNYSFDKWMNGSSQIKNNLGTENLLIKMGGLNFTTGLTFRF